MSKISTHIAAFIAATVMTVATQGTMLWQFDLLAQNASSATSAEATQVVKLDTVTVIARRV